MNILSVNQCILLSVDILNEIRLFINKYRQSFKYSIIHKNIVMSLSIIVNFDTDMRLALSSVKVFELFFDMMCPDFHLKSLILFIDS